MIARRQRRDRPMSWRLPLQRTSRIPCLRTLTVTAAIAVLCSFCIGGCGRHPKKVAEEKAPHPAHKVIDLRETTGLNDRGEIVGDSAWSAGENLEVWFRDAGDALAIATRSKSQVLIHVDVNRNGIADTNIDRVYGVGPERAARSQFSRPLWATAAWDEVKTLAAAETRNGSGGPHEVLWSLPKRELGPLQSGAEIGFEVFDEYHQTREFRPGPLFETTLRLAYTKSSAAGLGDSVNPKSPQSGPRAPIVRGPEPVPPKNEGLRKPAPPTITNFRAEPGSIERGGTAVLRWEVRGAAGVKLEPGIGPIPSQGERSVSPEQTTTYTLIAEGPGGTLSSQFAVNVAAVPPPSIITFQGGLGAVLPGTSTSLRWSVTGRTSNIRIEPGFDALPTQGEREVTPERTTQYTLIAEGPGGRAESTFTVRVSLPLRPSVVFEASPESVPLGHSTTLRWRVTGASRVSVEPGIGLTGTSGTVTVKPLAPTRYTLTAESPGGSTTREVSVAVTRPSTVSGQLIWTGNVRGTQLITIDKDHADVGALLGELPCAPVIILPLDEKRVSVASTPSSQNRYERLVLRVNGNGPIRIVIRWSLQ